MQDRVRIFVNPHSGSGADREQEQRLTRAFAVQGCRAEITHLGKQVDLGRLAAADPVEIPYVAAGGDGTVNAVANVVARTERVMGVLPAGTLNHFARDLNLPADLDAAAEVIAACQTHRHIRAVDAAEVNGFIFVNNSSLGAYPAMVMDRERMKKRGRSKWAALAAASFRAFVRFRPLRVEVTIQGAHRVCTTPFLFVGNNEYCLEGLQVGRRERLDGGRLSLYLAPGANRADILRMVFAACLGRLKQVPHYEELLVEEFTVHVRGRRLRVALDGEVRRLPSPLRYRILPGALRVLSPEAGHAAPQETA